MTLGDVNVPAPEGRDDWVAAAEQRLEGCLARAKELRAVEGLPGPEAGSSGVLARLSDVRSRLDQLESLLTEIGQFRTGIRVVLREATYRAEDRWVEQITKSKRTAFGEYGADAPRERYARADAIVLGDRIVERQRQRVFDATQDAFDSIERMRRGLDAFRMDLHALFRAVSSPEHRLDRTDSVWS